jgi:hypothetical protein
MEPKARKKPKALIGSVGGEIPGVHPLGRELDALERGTSCHLAAADRQARMRPCVYTSAITMRGPTTAPHEAPQRPRGRGASGCAALLGDPRWWRSRGPCGSIGGRIILIYLRPPPQSPVTKATHPTNLRVRGLLRGQCLLGPAPITWQAVSRGQPAAAQGGDRERRGAHEPSRSLIRSGACADEDCPIPDSTQHIGSLVPRSPWHGPRHLVRETRSLEAQTPADRLP